ncbi:hypothetical protein L6452_33108 [Arctium lappa]|uniref:Uncharacterized protein n=1 Tax=Arctium lappa TaxID=4217 RepID=A0ACB8Z6D5_ARCLA|nr:hypothetical protein L6452_33108 [Arctium lappa]
MARATQDHMCGKIGHAIQDCPIRGSVCFECREPGHMKRECPKLVGSGHGSSFGLTARTEQPLKAPSQAFQMITEEAGRLPMLYQLMSRF